VGWLWRASRVGDGAVMVAGLPTPRDEFDAAFKLRLMYKAAGRT